MPINAHTQNAFIQRVYREHRIPMTEVVGLFYKNPAKANLENIQSILHQYIEDGKNGEIRIIDKRTGEAEFPRAVTPDNLENLSVVFNGLAAPEADRVELSPCQVVSCQEVDDNQHDLTLGQSQRAEPGHPQLTGRAGRARTPTAQAEPGQAEAEAEAGRARTPTAQAEPGQAEAEAEAEPEAEPEGRARTPTACSQRQSNRATTEPGHPQLVANRARTPTACSKYPTRIRAIFRYRPPFQAATVKFSPGMPP